MTKHTAGPWMLTDDGFIISGLSKGYITIADPHCSDLDIDESEANAALIAAAPEMLEALRYCIKGYDNNPEWSHVDALYMIGKAINKAENKAY